MAEGRCMKCKKQVQIKDGKEVVMKNGMKAMKGVCPHCGTKVFRILGKAK
jgi:DNA-directed RNA polymerase subunit RPC12/RpoP